MYCKAVGYRLNVNRESGWLVNLATLKSVRRRGVPLGAAARGRAAGAAGDGPDDGGAAGVRLPLRPAVAQQPRRGAAAQGHADLAHGRP